MRFDYDTSYSDGQALLRYRSDWVAYGLLAVLLLVAPWVLPKFFVGEITYLFIISVASLGLMVLKGYTGQVSLGHAAFVAIGAYSHVWMMNQGVPWLLSLPLAALVSGLVGFCIGLPAIRVSGLYLAMVTLAFSILVEHVVGRWKSVTGGFNGIAVPEPILFGFSLAGLRPFYYLCLVVLVLVLLGLINLMRSKTGRAFVGVRDSEAAAYGLGIWVAGYKVLAFVVSAAVTGLAGALLAHHVQFVTPEGFSLLLSLELVIGLLPTFISRIKPMLPDHIAKQSGLEIFMFGLVLALFVLFEPKGLNGRWIKLRSFFQSFPMYRRDTFRRGKTYMKSERYR
jgi:branched-chain amino acid transport system permease protein